MRAERSCSSCGVPAQTATLGRGPDLARQRRLAHETRPRGAGACEERRRLMDLAEARRPLGLFRRGRRLPPRGCIIPGRHECRWRSAPGPQLPGALDRTPRSRRGQRREHRGGALRQAQSALQRPAVLPLQRGGQEQLGGCLGRGNVVHVLDDRRTRQVSPWRLCAQLHVHGPLFHLLVAAVTADQGPQLVLRHPRHARGRGRPAARRGAEDGLPGAVQEEAAGAEAKGYDNSKAQVLHLLAFRHLVACDLCTGKAHPSALLGLPQGRKLEPEGIAADEGAEPARDSAPSVPTHEEASHVHPTILLEGRRCLPAAEAEGQLYPNVELQFHEHRYCRVLQEVFREGVCLGTRKVGMHTDRHFALALLLKPGTRQNSKPPDLPPAVPSHEDPAGVSVQNLDGVRVWVHTRHLYQEREVDAPNPDREVIKRWRDITAFRRSVDGRELLVQEDVEDARHDKEHT
mmetsp:Transcript_118111/g.329300  ORF Transcript_118111/g.329300 Transcript_118111/m.329300 type:complete len:460 (+) Transcript_118111:303-1682(+)